MEQIIDFNKKHFKKISGEEIPDVISYIEQLTEVGEDVRTIVGCDSKQRAGTTIYSLAIVLYDEFRHNGAHVIYIKIYTKREKDLFTRLFNETLYALNLGTWLDENLKIEKPEFNLNDYDGSNPYRKVEIHVDINPKEKFKSNVAYKASMGILTGSGFSTKAKNKSFAASCAADYLMK